MKLTVLFFLCSLTLFAQNIAEGIINDSETGKPIPYVNIGITKKNRGTVSDINGNFEIEIPTDSEKDILILSSIGYQTKSMPAEAFLTHLKSNPILKLQPKINVLEEVIITNKKLKEKLVGNKTKSNKFKVGFNSAALGHEIGTKIRIKNSTTYLKKFHANIFANTNKTMKFRMNFYNIKDDLPGNKIINENILFSINLKKGDFTLDLEQYNIIVEEDFYCTIELIESQKLEDEIFFSAGFLGKKMIYRTTSQGEWNKIGIVGIGFNFTIKY